MAIGTSLGAYFESPFHQQAGIETPQEVIKPKDTGDDNTLPPDQGTYDDKAKIIPVSDMKTASPLVTITDEDIDKGISIGTAFSGGGLIIRRGAQVRSPANDNFAVGDPKRPYNVEDPSMIGSKEMDDALNASWNKLSEQMKQAETRYRKMDSLSEEMHKLEVKQIDTPLSEFEKARMEKLRSEWQDHLNAGE